MPSICILVNEKDKKALLFASDNPCLYLSNLISRLITKKHSSKELYRDRAKLRLKVLVSSSDSREFKWDLYFWHTYYTNLGYTFYSQYKPLQLIPHIKVDYRYGVMVELCNKGNKGFVCGVFDSMDKTVEWVEECLVPGLEAGIVLFSNTKESSKYYLTDGRNSSKV